MTRWFRHYAGMVRDEKLVRAAMRSKQSVERVAWVWGAVLESAAEVNDAGRFDFDSEEAAYFLRCDAADLSAILEALCDLGRLSDGRVTKWGERQFDSDSSKERQQRYRDRRRASRDGEVTPQETEAEAEKEIENKPASLSEPRARDFLQELWDEFPRNPTSSFERAQAAFSATKAAEHPEMLAAAQRFSTWFRKDNEGRKRTVEAGLRFVPHLSTWLEEGSWRRAPDPKPAKVVRTVRLDRSRDEALWRECERINGKKAPTADWEWAFAAEVVDKARMNLLAATVSTNIGDPEGEREAG